MENISHSIREKAASSGGTWLAGCKATHANRAQPEEAAMPEKKTLQRARRDKREGKSPSTQAGEFVHEEIEHVRKGKHGARSSKQAIAIGLSKARQAGIAVPAKKGAKKSTAKKSAAKKSTAKKTAAKKAAKSSSGRAAKKTSAPSKRRSRATSAALKREGRSAASHRALSKQAHSAARKRSAASRSAAAKKAARTKGASARSAAAKKAARTRARRS
jgi:hypothetical protein